MRGWQGAHRRACRTCIYLYILFTCIYIYIYIYICPDPWRSATAYGVHESTPHERQQEPCNLRHRYHLVYYRFWL